MFPPRIYMFAILYIPDLPSDIPSPMITLSLSYRYHVYLRTPPLMGRKIVRFRGFINLNMIMMMLEVALWG